MNRTFSFNSGPKPLCIAPKQDKLPDICERSQTWSCSQNQDADTNLEEIVNELFDGFDVENLMGPNEFFDLDLSNLTDIIEDGGTSQNNPESSFPSSDEVIIIEGRKHKTDLQKVCGFQSYQHIIEKAISSSSEKHLTLNQIYDWIEENVRYFCNLSKTNNSKSWKNSIRHNLSLHKQFYKVLREGTRSCLWGCDRSRTIKNSDKMTKKKIKQPIAYFRPRARTEPTMVKPMILLKKTTQAHEAEFIGKPVYKNLSARFEAIEAKQEGPNQGNLPQNNENIINYLINTNGSNFIENQISPPQFVTQNMTVSLGNHLVEHNLIRNDRYVNMEQKCYEISQNKFTSPIINFVASLTNDAEEFFPLKMILDEQAIIDHECNLHEMNYCK